MKRSTAVRDANGNSHSASAKKTNTPAEKKAKPSTLDERAADDRYLLKLSFGENEDLAGSPDNEDTAEVRSSTATTSTAAATAPAASAPALATGAPPTAPASAAPAHVPAQAPKAQHAQVIDNDIHKILKSVCAKPTQKSVPVSVALAFLRKHPSFEAINLNPAGAQNGAIVQLPQQFDAYCPYADEDVVVLQTRDTLLECTRADRRAITSGTVISLDTIVGLYGRVPAVSHQDGELLYSTPNLRIDSWKCGPSRTTAR